MIKRIIFDIDDTLIKWKLKYLSALKDTIDAYGLTIDYRKLDGFIEEYESKYDKYTKKDFLEFINKKFNLDLKEDFLNKWLYEYSFKAEYNEDVYNVLKYLSKKYELVILSNWFRDNQIARLKVAKIDKFFNEIYGGDEFIKPNLISFKTACGNHKPEECVMVGDSYKIDIEGALKCGLNAIWITKNKKIKKDNLHVIKNINEILNIL